MPVPALRGGAVNRFWAELAPELVLAGHSVTIIARHFQGQPSTETLNGVNYIRRGGFDALQYRSYNYLRSLVSSIMTTIRLPPGDIYITNDAFSPWMMGLYGRSAKTLVAVGRAPKGQYRSYPRKLTLAVPTRAIANSILLEAPQFRERCHVLPYAIDTDIFCPRATISAQTPSLDESNQFPLSSVLYAGRIHPEKGIDLLLAAFRLAFTVNRKLQLTVVGPVAPEEGGGGPAYLRSLQMASTDLPVTWKEPIFEVIELANLYRSHGWFVYPSLSDKGETFGLAPLEAMACGAVPIVSGLECFKDFIDPNVNALVFDHRKESSVIELANILASLPDHRHDVMSQSAQHAAANFGLSMVVKKWLRVLENIYMARAA